MDDRDDDYSDEREDPLWREMPKAPRLTPEQQAALERFIAELRAESERHIEQMERDRQKRIEDGVEEA